MSKLILLLIVALSAIIYCVSLAFTLPSKSSGPKEVQGALTALDGAWFGSLEYEDYQSSESVKIPASAHVDAASPEIGILVRLEFEDPGETIGQLNLLRVADTTLTTHSFSAQAVEQASGTIVDFSRSGPSEWVLTTEREAEESGESVTMKQVYTLNAASFRLATFVRPTGAEDGEWLNRNTLSLARVKAQGVDDLLGRWKVDLRPTPDAPAYIKELVFAKAEDGTLSGSFYDSEMQEIQVNLEWGSPQLAFTTTDGTETYVSNARMDNGTLRGGTLSLGRDFYSVWSATR